MGMTEFEYTYLAKYFPDDLFDISPKRIVDLYLPKDARKPTLRLRAKNDEYSLTKKNVVDGDVSQQIEQTIVLSPEEFDALSFQVEGKTLVKDRYEYPLGGLVYEFDVFREDLLGLVLIEVEFSSAMERDNFVMPDFCLADVTYDEWVAGGMLAGKSYADISDYLDSYSYQKLL